MPKIKERYSQDQFSEKPSMFHKKGNRNKTGKKEIMIIKHSIRGIKIYLLRTEILNLPE